MRISIILCALLLTLPLSTFATTGTNKQVNFQGKVVNTNGTNVTDGSYSFTFNIYTVSSAGTAIWTETKSLTVTDGIFRTDLGDSTTFPGSVDFNTDNIYLGINFNSDGEMSPRVRFTAVPQAFNADKIDGVDSTSLLRSDISTAFTSGTLTFNDSTVLAIGTGNDLQLTHDGSNSSITSATGNLTINNTDATGATIAKLGTVTSATIFQIQNSSSLGLLTVDGTGALTATGTIKLSAFTINGGLLYTNALGVVAQTGAGTSTTILHGGTTPSYSAIVAADITADSLDFTEFQDTLDLDAALTLNQTTNTWSQTFTGDTTTGLTYTANSLTSGSAFAIASSGTAFTGSLENITLSGSNAANTGNLLLIADTGALNTTTPFKVTAAGASTQVAALIENTGSGTSFRVNDGASDTTPFIIDANGNVGIGDPTPLNLLTVGSGDTFQVSGSGAIAAATGINSSGQIVFTTFTTNAGLLYTNGSGILAQTGAGTSTTILHGGTTPSYSAIVAADITADSLDFTEFQDTLDLDAALTLNQTTNTWSQTFTGTTTTGLTYTADSLTSGSAFAIASSGTAFTGSLESITLSGSNAANTGNLLLISDTGALNTTTPFKVTAAGASTQVAALIENTGSGTSFRVNDASADSTPFLIDSSGNVGIGTTAPLTTLDVRGAGSFGRTSTFNSDRYGLDTFYGTNPTGDTQVAYGLNGEIDTTNDSYTSYQPIGLEGLVRYRGSASESASGKGARALEGSMFVYNTGTTQYASGLRADARNLGAGTVTNLQGAWVPSMLNSGGGAVTNTYGLRIDAQSIGTNNYGIYSAIASAGTNYNIYAVGTAQNYFAGNVGIGTTSPGTALEINNSTDAYDYIKINDTSWGTVGARKGIIWNQGALELSAIDNVLEATGQAGLRFSTYNSGVVADVLVLSASGNVGIGTTAPLHKLTIGYGTQNIAFEGTAGVPYQGLGYDTTLDSANGGLVFKANIGAGDLNTNQMVILRGSGNVGIGTTSPNVKLAVLGEAIGSVLGEQIYNTNNTNAASHARLQVVSGGASGGDPILYLAVAGVSSSDWSLGVDNSDSDKLKIGNSLAVGTNTFMTFLASGNVGIGETSPDSALHVTGSTPAITVEGTGTYSYITFLNSGGATKTGTIVVNSSSTMSAYAEIHAWTDYLGTTEKMRLTSAGSLGIGDASPAALLTVGSGDLFQVNSSGAIAAVVGITSSSNYSQSAGTFSLTSANTTQVTTASAVAINVNSLTSGTGLYIASSNSGQTSNKLLDISQTGVTTGFIGNLINLASSSTTGAATFIKLVADSSTVGIGQSISMNGITTGTGFKVSSSATTGITTAGTNVGSLLDVTESGAMTLMTGQLVSINASGLNTSGATGSALNINIAGTGQVMNGIKIVNATTTAVTGSGISISMPSVTTTSGLRYARFNNAAGTEIGSISNSSASAIAFNTSSDRRLKDNIVDTHFGLTDLMKVGVKDFMWHEGGTADTGFIAQDLYAVYPDAVMKGDNGIDPYIAGVTHAWSIDYGKVTPLLVAAIKDQQGLLGAYSENSDIPALIATVQAEPVQDAIQILTNNASAGKKLLADLVSARVTALHGNFDSITVNSITAGSTGSLTIKADAEKQFMTFDKEGNAVFAGGIIAKYISATSIEGFSEMQASIADLIEQLKAQAGDGLSLAEEAKLFAKDLLFGGKIAFASDVTMSSTLIANALEVNKSLVAVGTANFKGEVTISNKQAGFAKVLKDAVSVDVVFEKELTNTPIVQVTAQGESPTYYVKAVTTKGFTIKLTAGAVDDTNYSWTAITAQDPKTTTGKPAEPTPTPDPTLTPEPTREPDPAP